MSNAHCSSTEEGTNKLKALFFSAATLSGAFGGLIAYGVQHNLTYAATGRYPWQWLFIIEGVLAIGVGILIIILLPRVPDDLSAHNKGHWLFDKAEIELAKTRYGCKSRQSTE